MKVQPLVAEFLGTFFLCFAGIGAVILGEFVMTFLLMTAIFGRRRSDA